MKYHNKTKVVDGIKFQSINEANRYVVLKTLEEVGKITDLKLQVPFELIPRFKKNGKTYRKCVYIADFTYFDSDGRYIVEDAKSVATRKDKTYRLKKKLFEYTYQGLEIKEVL